MTASASSAVAHRGLPAAFAEYLPDMPFSPAARQPYARIDAAASAFVHDRGYHG